MDYTAFAIENARAEFQPLALTPKETAAVLIGRIADLVIGETLQLVGGHIVRVKRSEYVLHADANVGGDHIIEIDNDGVVSEVVIGPIREGGPLHLKKEK